MKIKILIISLILVIVATTLFFLYGNNGSTEKLQKEKQVVYELMHIFKGIDSESTITLEYFFIQVFRKQYGRNCSKKQIDRIEEIFDKYPQLEIHGRKSDAISFEFEFEFIELQSQRVSGIVFSRKRFEETDKYEWFSNERNFEYEQLESSLYSFNYEKHVPLLHR